MKRSADIYIEDFYKKNRNALLLTGARQVGKTYAVRKYASNAGLQLVEINFALQPESKNVFQGVSDINELLLRISALSKKRLDIGRTLIFLDEIQEYPDAMTWIKALVEDGRFRYALSGSLLGVELRNIRSLPVGYVTEYRMFPMDFEEFIGAVGVGQSVIDVLWNAWHNKTPVDAFVHTQVMKLFNLYLLVGGMPAVVDKYIHTNDMRQVVREQRSILNMYKMDIARFVSGQKLYINEIFDLIPSELNAKNKRFILKNLNEHIKFSRHEGDFVWLKEADMALPTFNVEEPQAPLKLNEQRNLFKLFQNDVGLLASQYADGFQLKILNGEVSVNFGAIYENAIAQELHAHGWPLYYLNSKRLGEVDFIIENDGEVIPIEVKSGKDYNRHNALSNLLSSPTYDIRNAYIFCNDNLHVKGQVAYCPVYMVDFLRRQAADESFLYEVDLEGLR